MNTKILARNISINNLTKKINIVQLPLSDKKNQFDLMSESTFEEGGSFNSFSTTNNSGIFKKKINKYYILGTNLNYLINNKIIPLPNYIKIDVDWIENLILVGLSNFLRHTSIRSILIELYPGTNQFKSSLKILKESGFDLISNLRNNYLFNRIK